MERPLRKAIILAGGFGSRMKELTNHTPKPMLPLQGQPVLQYNIDLCRRYGITDIALSVHYLKDQIKAYYGDGSRFGVNITYVEEDTPLGTAGAMRLAKEWLDGPFLMCNADELKDINLEKMYKWHRQTGATVTIALTEVEDPSQYGVTDLDGLRIKRFVEKPKKEEAPSKWINSGLYIIEPSVVDRVPEGFCMVEKDIFPSLAEQGKLFGFQFRGQWFDTGTPERYVNTEASWKGFKEQALLAAPINMA